MGVTNDPFKNMQNFAVMVVARFNSSTGGAYDNTMVAADNNSSYGWSLQNGFGDNLNFRTRGFRNDLVSGSRPQDVTNNFIGTGWMYDSTTAQKRFNGTTTQTSSGAVGAISYDSAGTNRSGIGAIYTSDNWGSGGSTLNGSLKEVVVVDDANSNDVYRVEGYLAWKWGIQDKLPPTHPYADGAPEYSPAGTVIIIQ
jgi:hypothetical protein